MFQNTANVGNAGVPNKLRNIEWKYLVRVLILIFAVGFVIWKLYFAWWMPNNDATATQLATTQTVTNSITVAGESNTIGLDAEMNYIKVNETLIIDKETFDVLLCTDGVTRDGCIHTELNCSNVGDVDLLLRAEENLKRCNRNEAQSDNARYENPNQPPVCTVPQRLWFTPSTMAYECK